MSSNNLLLSITISCFVADKPFRVVVFKVFRNRNEQFTIRSQKRLPGAKKGKIVWHSIKDVVNNSVITPEFLFPANVSEWHVKLNVDYVHVHVQGQPPGQSDDGQGPVESDVILFGKANAMYHQACLSMSNILRQLFYRVTGIPKLHLDEPSHPPPPPPPPTPPPSLVPLDVPDVVNSEDDFDINDIDDFDINADPYHHDTNNDPYPYPYSYEQYDDDDDDSTQVCSRCSYPVSDPDTGCDECIRYLRPDWPPHTQLSDNVPEQHLTPCIGCGVECVVQSGGVTWLDYLRSLFICKTCVPKLREVSAV